MAINTYANDRANQIAMDTNDINNLLEKLQRVQKNLQEKRDAMANTFKSLDEKEAWDAEVSASMHQVFNNSLAPVCDDCIGVVGKVIGLVTKILENNTKLHQQFVNMSSGANAQSAQAAQDAEYIHATNNH